MQTKIPCIVMRGGTSRGPFFLATDLPSDQPTRDEVLLAVMGSAHEYQVDGIGGATPFTSKVAIISKSTRPNIDVDYLFAQVLVNERRVDTKPNCGNMLSAVGSFAIERLLVKPTGDKTTIKIFNVNTQAIVEAIVETPHGVINYDGEVSIDGVPGTAAPVLLNFTSAIGSVTGKLLPTGQPTNIIQGITVSCVDVAMPMMLIDAEQLGKTGHETASELDHDLEFMRQIESIRLEAGHLMGLGDVSQSVVPKIGLLSKPAHGGTISSRYFVPYSCHKAHAVTGAVCVASACAIPGTIAARLSGVNASSSQGMIDIEHPTGKITIDLDASLSNSNPVIRKAALVRTARKVFEGYSCIPETIWVNNLT